MDSAIKLYIVVVADVMPAVFMNVVVAALLEGVAVRDLASRAVTDDQ